MRVIAGSLRSRAIKAPKGNATRPTSDRVREALFAVLGDVVDARVLDLYAGSGALAIEALSRGAASAVCVDDDRHALGVLRENAKSLGLEGRMHILPRRVQDCGALLEKSGPFHLVFADPPYAHVTSGALLAALSPIVQRPTLFTEDALFVIEHASRDELQAIAGLDVDETRRWGDTAVTMLRRSLISPPPPPS